MKLSVKGMLVAAIAVSTASGTVMCKDVVVSDLSTAELFQARSNAKENEYLALHELAAKTQLIDDKGVAHSLTYEMLNETSSVNFKKLEELDYQLSLKLGAESLESPSS